MADMTYAFPKLKDVEPASYIDAYNLILECSRVPTPKEFVIKFFELAERICPYDQAVAFFTNPNGKPIDKYAINMDIDWLESYINYYIKYISPTFSTKDLYYDSPESFFRIHNWKEYSGDEFLMNLTQKRGIYHSWGFFFFDLSGNHRVVLSLDRTTDTPFSQYEKNTLSLALPVLNNVYRNFYYQSADSKDNYIQSPWANYKLTARELEIANLLSQGMSVANISNFLSIKNHTVYKHIGRICEKFGVSTQQELLVIMLNKKL